MPSVGLVVGRDAELGLISRLLDNARDSSAALIIDGEPGIGKTTLCRAAAEKAALAGFAVLTTSGAAAEVSLAWAAFSDLVAPIDSSVRAGLSPLHQQTLQAVQAGEPGGGERLVAAAFGAALRQMSQISPVLIVIDDAQWLDETSRRALGFAVRRLTGPVAVLAAYRGAGPRGQDRSWVNPPDPQALTQLTMGPMPLEDLSAVIAQRAGEFPARPVLQHIYAVSDGNPFYALELARFLDAGNDRTSLPPTLTELVRERVGAVDAAAAEVLATAAAAFEPSVEIIAAATGRTPADIVEVLQPMESRGVLGFEGPRIRFTHPLIMSGIATGADPAMRRRAHRRLADVVGDPEQRARHLAFSSPFADPETLAALDAAAENAAARGAFSTAAELVGLALRSGGDNEMRRLRGAEYHFRAGALDEADALLAPIIEDLPAGLLRAVGLMLLAAVRGYGEGVASTIGLFRRAVQEAEDMPTLRTQALVLLSLATGISGDMATCVEDARRARADAEALGLPELKSQALSLWSHVSFMYGLGTDTEALQAALEIEDPDLDAPIMLRPTPVHAMNCAWTGRLDVARDALTDVRRSCEERGTELDVLWAVEQLTWIEVAAGRYGDAQRLATDALKLARQIGGELPLITAHTAVAHAAAYRGRLQDARAAAEYATTRATAVGLGYLADPPLMSLAFAQVSDGGYDSALETLAPLLTKFDPEHDTEIMAGGWIPDAVEALTATGRGGESEPLVAAVETNGARHDRPWMLAVGARCRALVHAAEGNLDGAIAAAEAALAHHDRLPMPFERARTQLLLGQLQRRRRRTTAARENLSRAAAVFDELDSPLWAQRAHSELSRLTARRPGAALTDSERQVAEHAVAGLTNRQIAAAMFLSEKTVEMHLSNTYRKLGIRSRAQLAERLMKG
ncbi:MAG: AAA family ATPase [Mycobacterium sp.]